MLPYCQSVFFLNCLYLREITQYLFVQIYKADNTGVCITFHFSYCFLKPLQVECKRIIIRYKNRVISPADAIRSDHPGKLLKTFYHLILIRNYRFDFFSIRRNRHKPVLPIRFQQIHIREHRLGIFGAKGNQIHHFRRQIIPGYLQRIIRIADKHIPFLYSVCQPFTVKCRNIRAHTGLDNHVFTFFRIYKS